MSKRFARLIRRYNAIRRHRFEDGWTIEQIINRSRVTQHEAEAALSGPPLPPVRLLDLRHGSATMLLAPGVEMKVVAENFAEEAAVKMMAYVPRRKRA